AGAAIRRGRSALRPGADVREACRDPRRRAGLVGDRGGVGSSVAGAWPAAALWHAVHSRERPLVARQGRPTRERLPACTLWRAAALASTAKRRSAPAPRRGALTMRCSNCDADLPEGG